MTTTAHGWGTVLIVALSARIAQGAEPASIGLSYEADPSCPDGNAFAELVHRQAASLDLTPAATGQAEVVVLLRSDKQVFQGSLQIRRSDGSNYLRELEAASCKDLAPALAFVTVLALSGQLEPEVEVLPRPAVTPPASDQPTIGPGQTPRHAWRWGVGAGLGIRYGIAPTWANTEQLLVELRPPGDSVLSPSFQVAFLHAGPVTRIDRAGTTEFKWMAGRLGGCPLGIRPFAGLELRPCLGIDGGSIGASGVPVDTRGQGHDSHSLWADAFATARLRLHLAGPVFATGEAELVLSFTPYGFGFDPGTPVYEIPVFAGAGAIGLFAQFP